MAHDADKRREARRRYVFERQALPAIAVFVGVPEATLRRWKSDARRQGDDWDQARAANTMAGEGLDQLIMQVVQDYVTVHQATIDDLKESGLSALERAKALAGLADSFNKTVSAAGRLTPKISELGVAADVLKRLADYIAQSRPDLSEAFLEVLEPFGLVIAEAYK